MQQVKERVCVQIYQKYLQPLAGRPLLGHVIDTAKKLQAEHIITIYGHGGALVQNAFAHEQVQWVEQAEQLGTGHAVKVTLPVLPREGVSLILSGDVPCYYRANFTKATRCFT